jgi:hypothetical protein
MQASATDQPNAHSRRHRARRAARDVQSLPEASWPAADPRRSALPLERFVADYGLGWADLVRLILTDRAPLIVDLAGKLVVFGEDAVSWRTRERLLSSLARDRSGSAPPPGM